MSDENVEQVQETQKENKSMPPPNEGKRLQTDIDSSMEPLKKKKERVLPFESTYLRSVPSASQYEKSFMHIETLSHVIATDTDFIITASIDGHLKFWKKKYGEGIEFVKHFRCHLSAFADIAVNFNGTLLATACMQDKSVKIFDVENFDMINILKLDFVPKTLCWVHQGADIVAYLAISNSENGNVVVVDGKGTSESLAEVSKLHSAPVRIMAYNTLYDIVVSVDEKGMIEYWSGVKKDCAFPDNIAWKYKTDTDLYEYVKVKTVPVCIAMNPKGNSFAILSQDRKLRVFNIRTGKITNVIDETIQKLASEAKDNKSFGLQNMEWNRRLALEKDMDKDVENAFRFSQISWDHSGHFILYPSPVGVKVYNVVTDKVVREIGKEETVRFLSVSLCRAVPDVRARLQGSAATIETEAADNPTLTKTTEPDPIMVCCAYKKNRFYIFTNCEPYNTEDNEDDSGMSRDVFNERPKKEDQITAVEKERESNLLCEKAILHTSMGDIVMKLFGRECSRTVENFCTLSRRGYYNGLTFHRVIKSFMIQTGDPTGKGTGGNSIWEADFEDEFHPRLKHDKPFMVSMANAGPNSNGSQFFITVCPAEWLDGKNTLFGEVVEGMSVVQKINQVQTYEKSGRPKQEIKILSVTLKMVDYLESFDGTVERKLEIRKSDKGFDLRMKSSTSSIWSLSSFYKFLLCVFLPQGYPHSVSSDYLSYQIWDTIQAFASSMTGALATEAVLRGAGVGNDKASVLATALTWIVKDGLGMVGRIAFTYFRGTDLDSNPKKWRLVADILNDVAFFIDLLSPAFPSLFFPFACTSSLFRCVVGVAGGATRTSIVQHQAIRNNLADVAAKDGSQETLVNVAALIASLLLLPMVSGKQQLVWTLYLTFFFLFFTFVHLYSNYRAVRSLSLKSLNRNRSAILIEAYLNGNKIPEIKECNNLEPLFSSVCPPSRLGCSLTSIKKYLDAHPLNKIIEEKQYFLMFDSRRNLGMVAVSDDVEDQLQPFYHLQCLASGKDFQKSNYMSFKTTLASLYYDVNTLQLGYDGWSFKKIQ